MQLWDYAQQDYVGADHTYQDPLEVKGRAEKGTDSPLVT